MVTEIEKTQERIKFIQEDIESLKQQATIGAVGDAVKRYELNKLETVLGQQKRKLARLEQKHA